MRTGLGFDIHRFKEGRKFILGGVHIPCSKGLLGHSDGDALLHALSDALLGAAGKPDIGFFFPDDEEKIKGINSGLILQKTLELIEGYRIENLDIVVICDSPKLLPFADAIKNNIAGYLKIRPEDIGFKAKTTEGLIGAQGDLCACMVSTLIQKKDKTGPAEDRGKVRQAGVT